MRKSWAARNSKKKISGRKLQNQLFCCDYVNWHDPWVAAVQQVYGLHALAEPEICTSTSPQQALAHLSFARLAEKALLLRIGRI
jgi:hypothetical protein